MEVLKKIEEALKIKIENVEEIKEKSFPLFDMTNVHGIKLALIKDPVFVVIGDDAGDDVYEKKLEGNFVIAEVDGKYIVAKYTGEPNIEALRDKAEKEEPEQVAEEQEEAETQGEENEEADGNVDREEQKPKEDENRGSNPVEEILEKMPQWADGAVVVEKNGGIAVLPIKKSTKKENAYYSSVTWKPLNLHAGVMKSLVNHVITRDGKAIKSNVYIGDKYINIFVGSSNRPRYSGRR
jgi:hypothetical protein